MFTSPNKKQVILCMYTSLCVSRCMCVNSQFHFPNKKSTTDWNECNSFTRKLNVQMPICFLLLFCNSC
ncbi:hypothetical protein BX070DRAFT_219287 [Coemansia spiralis]|nr:hypothetical protein BX070DRAFT_219287 [Coemansia spiralis]